MKKIAIITDTWQPNLNGIVTAIANTKKYLELKGFEVRIIHSGEFATIRMPSDNDLKLAILNRQPMEDILNKENPDYIHIATEATVGLAGRRACTNNNWKFTTTYHTQIPEYLEVRMHIPAELTYSYMRWFHNGAEKIMVATTSLKQMLAEKEFKNLTIVPLGVDVNAFQKNPNAQVPEGFKKPIFVFLGRVAFEKNIEAFLQCQLPGMKLIIGDGPAKPDLQEKYPEAHFVGYKKGQEIVDLLSISDVFVFPSKTDTFGLTVIEAMSVGLPAAAFDVPGPKDIITNGVDGYLGDDLQGNAIKCLTLNPKNSIKKAHEFSWSNSVDKFIANLVPK